MQGFEGYALTMNDEGRVLLSGAIFGNLEHRGAGTLGEGRGVHANAFLGQGGSGAADRLIALRADVQTLGDGSVASAYGLFVKTRDRDGNAGRIGTAYGLYVADLEDDETWGIYQADPTDANFFAGNVRIGGAKASEPSLTADGPILAAIFPPVRDSHALCVSGESGSVIGTCAQRREDMEDVRPWAAGGSPILSLRPVTFRWRNTDALRLGLVAEEVEAVDPRLVRARSGEPVAIDHDALIAALVGEVQSLRDALTKLKARVREVCPDP